MGRKIFILIQLVVTVSLMAVIEKGISSSEQLNLHYRTDGYQIIEMTGKDFTKIIAKGTAQNEYIQNIMVMITVRNSLLTGINIIKYMRMIYRVENYRKNSRNLNSPEIVVDLMYQAILIMAAS